MAFGLRVYRLGGQSIWYDEALSVHYARQPLTRLLALVAASDHPPFYFLLLHGWLRLWPDPRPLPEFWVRFPSVMAGALTIPLIYRLGRALRLPPRAALLAAWGAAVSPFQVWYAQETRMYTVVLALTLWGGWWLLRCIAEGLKGTWAARGRGGRGWGGCALATAWGFHSRPYAALGSLAMGQLARRLNLPLRCAGNFTNSKLPDAQAMSQGLMSMMSAVQCGANYILHSAGFLDGLLSMSYEKFVMDTDLCGALHAYLRGIEVNEDALGFEALAELGPGQHLFSTAHTLRHYQSAYWDSALADNQPWETWDEQGRIDMAARANARWKKLLAEYEAPPLDDGIDEGLRDFMARKKEAVPDAWY